MKIVDGYHLIELPSVIDVTHLISVHYFEYSKHYEFKGEHHHFWELVYVDKGAINITAGDRDITLEQGEMIFHEPNEWHTVVANGEIAPNLIVIGFNSESEAMSFFKQKRLTINSKMRSYLGTILSEAGYAFDSDFGDPTLRQLTVKEDTVIGSIQLVKLYIELLLIDIIRHETSLHLPVRTTPMVFEFTKEDKVKDIVQLLKDNIHGNIKLDKICKHVLLSKSSVQKLFKDTIGVSIMEYFKKLKISHAKKLVREHQHNFTEIASILGYNSIHYFSRSFKSVVGMTPTEYSNSIKKLLD